jgi:hypothetical protein
MNEPERFATIMIGVVVVAAVLDVVFVPAGYYSELLFLGPATGVGFLLAYWIVYR